MKANLKVRVNKLENIKKHKKIEIVGYGVCTIGEECKAKEGQIEIESPPGYHCFEVRKDKKQ